MAGLFGLFGGGAGGTVAQAPKPIYSIEHMQQLYNRLAHISEKDADCTHESNREALVEVIRQLTEALIWGERHDHNFFDFFCEKNMLSHFVKVLDRPLAPKTVKVQLLQTLSMLIQNIRRDTSLYYLFSNNYVNQLISTQFDWNDEEILGYYISFLKSLALRLNAETVKFFFNERAQLFPLYIEALRFFSHRDGMVRAAVRALTLQVYRIEDEAMRKFVLEKSARTYFVHLSCYLRELWYRLDSLSSSAAGGSGEHGGGIPYTLQEVNEEQQDLIMYLADILDSSVPALAQALADRILHYAVYPVIVGSILAAPPLAEACGSPVRKSAPTFGADADGDIERSNQARSPLSPAMALFVLHQVIDTFRSPYLLKPLAEAMLRNPMPLGIRGRCTAPAPLIPSSYRGSYLADGSTWAPAESSTGTTPKATVGTSGGEASSASAAEAFASVTEAEEPAPPEPEVSASDSGVAVRSRLYEFIGATSSLDVCALLVAGILRLCVKHEQLLPEGILQDARVLPVCKDGLDAKEEQKEVLVDDVKESDVEVIAEAAEGHQVEVMLRTVQALENHAALRVVVVQALASFALELSALLPADMRGTAAVLARRVAREAARQAQSHLHGALGDGFLDVFAEEWEQHRGPLVEIQEVSNNVRCLVPGAPSGSAPSSPPAEWALPAPRSERQHAAKAIRCLLIAQWLHRGLLNGKAFAEASRRREEVAAPQDEKPERPVSPRRLTTSEALQQSQRSESVEAGAETQPLHIDGEMVDGYQEGRSFELGRQDRIVCGVVTPEGRHTRYLVLHPFLLLLVQPDLVSPGWAAVRTLAPIRQVESQIDRTDQRTLRLGVRLPKGFSCPGEASSYDPATCEQSWRLPPEEHRSGSFFMLTLSFEDVKRCDCADRHVKKRRDEVRKQLRQRVEAFIESLCK